MTFDPRPNASGDNLASSRDPIRVNFEIIRDDFAIDHVEFDDANEGKHSQSTYVDLGADPAAAVNEIPVFSKADGSGVSQLHIRGEGTGSTYQLTTLTSGVDADIAEFGTNTPYIANHTGGWSFLPGGLILQYGLRSNLTFLGNSVVTFPRTFPNAVFSVTTTPIRDDNTSSLTYVRSTATVTTVQFQIRNTSTATVTQAYWYAIGN